MKRIRTHVTAAFGAVFLSFVLLAGMSPAASAAGPLFHNKSYPDFQLGKALLPEVTVEALCSANAYETLLEKYGGFGVETFANPQYLPEDSYSFYYGTADYNYYCYARESGDQPISAKLITETDTFRLTTAEDGSKEFSLDWTVQPGWEENRNDLRDEAMALDEEALAGYEIVSVEENEDGTKTVVLAEAVPAAAEQAPAEEDIPVFQDDERYYGYTDRYDQWDDYYDTDGYGFPYDEGFDWHYFGNGDYGYDYNDGFGYGYGWDWPEGADGEKSEVPNSPDAWYTFPAEEAPADDTWYDNTVTWFDEHPNNVSADAEEPQILVTLTVDAKTLEILKVEQSFQLDDGSEELLMVQVMSFDKPDSDIFDELMERGPLHYSEVELDSPRTVTVIVDAGTFDEYTVSRTVEKGDLLSTEFPYGYDLYSDEQGTPFFGSDGQSDVTVFCFPKDHVWMPPEESIPEEPAPEEPAFEEPFFEETPETEPVFLPVPGEIPVIFDGEGEDFLEEESAPALIIEDSVYDSAAQTGKSEEAAPALTEENGLESLSETEADAPEAEEAEPDFDTVNRAVFDANALEKILTNHSSVEYRLIFETESIPDWPDYIYETRDMAYAESPTTAIYVGNGNYYELSENGKGSELYYVFDLCNGYDPATNIGYEIVPESFEEWWNADEETALSCYKENGEIHLISLSSPEKSRDFLENYLNRAYDGELITTETVADAESYELLRFTYIMEKDGELSVPLSYEARYDLPEPRACRNLRAAAERDAKEVAVITLVMNPGTDDELVQTKAVPSGSNVVYIADEWMNMFEDPECTVPAEPWDKTSDHTYYMLPALPAAN